MKHKKIERIIDDSYKRIEAGFERVIRDFAERDIHTFRLEVKKLRAFLRLVATARTASPALALPGKLHAFYKETGIIRSLQIQLKRMKALPAGRTRDLLPGSYVNYVNEKMARAKGNAISKTKGKGPFLNGKHKLLRMLPSRLSRPQITEYTWSATGKMGGLLQPFFAANESMHTLRKLMKDLLYIWPWVGKDVSVILPSVMYSGASDMRMIARKLGEFQDDCVGLNLLREESGEWKPDEPEKLFLVRYARDLEKEKEVKREHLQTLVDCRISRKQPQPLLPESNHREKTRLLSI